MKTAICQVTDTGPLESLVVMLRSAGYTAHIPHHTIIRELQRAGIETGLSISGHIKNYGYEKPFEIPIASLEMMDRADLFVDMKAQRNAPKISDRWPNLKGKILWYRINGGEPANIPGYGNEREFETPLLTPNLWYAKQGPWSDKSYACWPPFYRFDEYYPKFGRVGHSDPICLVHNFSGWGYSPMQVGMKALGVKIHGKGSPDGLVNHSQIPGMLSKSLAMVHLKNNDAPGYALYEALAAACPLIVSQRLIVKNCMEDLFEDEETCFVFDYFDPGKVHHSHTQQEVKQCIKDAEEYLKRLSNPITNERIGDNGRKRLKELMWDEKRDGESFRQFMEDMFVTS